MSNSKDNSTNQDAALIADEIRFGPGKVYSSKLEFYRDQAHPRYRSDMVYRQNVDAKLSRSGRSFQNVDVIEADGGARFAVARTARDAQGKPTGVEISEVGMSGMNGGRPDEPSSKDTTADGPTVRKHAGGCLEVRVRHDVSPIGGVPSGAKKTSSGGLTGHQGHKDLGATADEKPYVNERGQWSLIRPLPVKK